MGLPQGENADLDGIRNELLVRDAGRSGRRAARRGRQCGELPHHLRIGSEGGGGVVLGIPGGLVCQCRGDVEDEGVEQRSLVCAARCGEHVGGRALRLDDFLPHSVGRHSALGGDAELCAVAGGTENAVRAGGAAHHSARGARGEKERKHRRVRLGHLEEVES